MEPKRLDEIFIVVRQDDQAAPLYAPRSYQVRSKKFFSEKEARKLLENHPTSAKLYKATVSEWEEIT